MKFAKRFTSLITLLTIAATFFTSNIHAQESCTDNGGCGYTECCRTSSLAPAIALGLIIATGIVAVAIQNTSGHAHCHSHE